MSDWPRVPFLDRVTQALVQLSMKLFLVVADKVQALSFLLAVLNNTVFLEKPLAVVNGRELPNPCEQPVAV